MELAKGDDRMIFQILQNRLHLTSAHMHILFLILMGLYLALQIIDRSKGTLTLIDEYGKKHIVDRDTGVWRDEHGDPDGGSSAEGRNDPSRPHKNARPNFVVSVLVSAVFGLASWMLTTVVIQFMPEAIVGREQGVNLGYEFFMVGSFLGVIPAFAAGIYLVFGFAGKPVNDDDPRFSFAVLAGSILPFYSFIHAVTPLKTDILFGVTALAETAVLVIGLIQEWAFGGGVGLIRALLEYAVSFALFSSLLTFPSITRHFFTVLGFIIAGIAACFILVEWMPEFFGIDFYPQPHQPDAAPGRMTNWDVSYRVLSNTLDKLEVEDGAYGTKYIYNKGLSRWEDSSGSPVSDPSAKGLSDISNFY